MTHLSVTFRVYGLGMVHTDRSGKKPTIFKAYNCPGNDLCRAFFVSHLVTGIPWLHWDIIGLILIYALHVHALCPVLLFAVFSSCPCSQNFVLILLNLV